MPEITAIRRIGSRRRGIGRAGSRLVIELGGAPWITIEEAEVVELGLHVGLELDGPDIERIESAASTGDSRDSALRLLARRAHSAGELAAKLERRAEPEEARRTVEALVERGLIDDVEYAQGLARRRLGQGWGPRRIEHDLQ